MTYALATTIFFVTKISLSYTYLEIQRIFVVSSEGGKKVDT